MRIRYPFAGAFAALVIISAYLGFTPTQIPAVDDKALHFVVFFLLTLTLYWALDLPRRVLLKLILTVSLALSVASEVAQGLLSSERNFDRIDIAANVLGSIAALSLCAWYHRRMLERKRKKKLQGYGIIAGEGEEDVELGEGGSSSQELGVVAEEDDEDGGEAWDDLDEVADTTTANGNTTTGKHDSRNSAEMS